MAKQTWNEYQNEYRKKHYKQISAHLEPELVAELKEQLQKDNITFTTFVRNAIDIYLGKK